MLRRRSLLAVVLSVAGATAVATGAVVVASAAREPGAAPSVGQPAGAGTAMTAPRPTLPRVDGRTTSRTGAGASGHRAAPAPPRLLPHDVRLLIPSIGVDSPVEKLGLNPDGTLQVPTDFSQVGWWSGGPFPGDKGSAVVVGHVSSVAGPGVFYRLDELKPGDLVTVTRPSGGRATFRVTRLLEVSKKAFPTRLVYGPAAGRQLRLITCGGPFNNVTGHFVDNLIVFASFVGG